MRSQSPGRGARQGHRVGTGRASIPLRRTHIACLSSRQGGWQARRRESRKVGHRQRRRMSSEFVDRRRDKFAAVRFARHTPVSHPFSTPSTGFPLQISAQRCLLKCAAQRPLGNLQAPYKVPAGTFAFSSLTIITGGMHSASSYGIRALNMYLCTLCRSAPDTATQVTFRKSIHILLGIPSKRSPFTSRIHASWDNKYCSRIPSHTPILMKSSQICHSPTSTHVYDPRTTCIRSSI